MNTFDQILHVLFGFFVTSLAVDGVLPGAYVGLAIGVIREQGQMWSSMDSDFGWKRAIDVSAWTLGGLLGGLV